MQRRAMLVGEPGYAQERRDPAHPHDVGLDDLGGTGVEELGEAIRGVEVLADGDGHRDPGGELDVSGQVVGAQRLLDPGRVEGRKGLRSEEHTSELQSLMRISYAVFCLKKNNITTA